MCWHGDEVDDGSSEVRFFLIFFWFHLSAGGLNTKLAASSGSMPALLLLIKTASVELVMYPFWTMENCSPLFSRAMKLICFFVITLLCDFM